MAQVLEVFCKIWVVSKVFDLSGSKPNFIPSGLMALRRNWAKVGKMPRPKSGPQGARGTSGAIFLIVFGLYVTHRD